MVDMTSSGGPIAEVREGMGVRDVDGESIGSVVEVRLGDPGAATGAGQGGGSTGLLGAIAEAFGGGGDVPEQAQERLVRLGYVRIDASGMFSGSKYVAGDEIAAVDGDTVRLSVPGDRLVG